MKKPIKIILATLAAVVLLIVAFIALQIIASERVEVVEIQYLESGGEPVVTRLWIVDDGDVLYLRSASGSSSWVAPATSQPWIELTRNGISRAYRAVPRPDQRDRINQLMREKYTWGDVQLDWQVNSATNALPVELQPL